MKKLFLMLLCATSLLFVGCKEQNNPQEVLTPDAIDLGLSVKWANMNVGAKNTEDYGDFFAWGETEPKSDYSWSTYKWRTGLDNITIPKYDTCIISMIDSIVIDSIVIGDTVVVDRDTIYKDSIVVDSSKVLKPEADAAYVNWGNNWRMPTNAELNELKDSCTWTWTMQNGVTGYTVTGKNGNFIFLPAAGFSDDMSHYFVDSYGRYWSSSLYDNLSNYVYNLYFYSNYIHWGYNNCGLGHSVRPVCQ